MIWTYKVRQTEATILWNQNVLVTLLWCEQKVWSKLKLFLWNKNYYTMVCTYKVTQMEAFCQCNWSLHVNNKGNRTIVDLRYGEKDIIRPSTLIFAPIEG